MIEYPHHVHDKDVMMIDVFDSASFFTDGKGTYLTPNAVASTLCGFKRPDDMHGTSYQALPSPLSAFARQFIEQDQWVLDNQQSLTFIEMFRYADNQYHCHLGRKSFVPQAQSFLVKATLFNITELINPILCELLSVQDRTISQKETRAFCYHLSQQDDDKAILTQREIQCVRYLMHNFTNKMIAARLNVSARTIESHINNIKNKLNLTSKAMIVAHCIQNNLLPINLFFKTD